MWWQQRLRPAPDTISIRSRLIGYLSAGFAVGLLVLTWAANSYGRIAADGSYDRLLSGSASSIAETLSITPASVRVDIPYAAMDMLAAAPNDKVFYRVVDVSGRTVTGYRDLPAGPETSAQSFAEKPVRFFDATYRGDPVRFVLLGREARVGGRTGWVVVQLGQTRLARAAMAKELTLRAVIPIVGLALLFFIVIWLGVGRALRPLDSIGSDLQQRDHSDFSKIDVGVPRELVPVVSALNGFMGRLDTSFAFLRTFIATAAHQLRTPLTALIVQISSAETSSGEQRAANVEAANASARQLARLLDQLPSDALVEHRSVLRRFDRIDLKMVVEQVIRDTVQLSRDSDIRFTTALSSAELNGDGVMLAEAIKNIVHNAIVHGYGADGTVKISLAREPGGFRLEVADRGPGLGNVAAAIADRFKSARSDATGAGLGLAIVNQVVATHGGRLSWSNRTGGGALIILWLPAE
jgi:two-component system sensor histidine kinase TctE